MNVQLHAQIPASCTNYSGQAACNGLIPLVRGGLHPCTLPFTYYTYLLHVNLLQPKVQKPALATKVLQITVNTITVHVQANSALW